MVFSECGEAAWTASQRRRSQLLRRLVERAGVLLVGRGGARLPQILKG
ncbi:hypothetical protein ACFWZT_05150 [Streptomyces alboflavus]